MDGWRPSDTTAPSPPHKNRFVRRLTCRRSAGHLGRLGLARGGLPGSAGTPKADLPPPPPPRPAEHRRLVTFRASAPPPAGGRGGGLLRTHLVERHAPPGAQQPALQPPSGRARPTLEEGGRCARGGEGDQQESVVLRQNPDERNKRKRGRGARRAHVTSPTCLGGRSQRGSGDTRRTREGWTPGSRRSASCRATGTTSTSHSEEPASPSQN